MSAGQGLYRICFVCTGNICRSPTAAVVLTSRVGELGWSDRVLVDSAGTGGWHAGERMDRRAIDALGRGGYDGWGHRAQRFERGWVGERELLVALDHSHLQFLERLAATSGLQADIRLLRSFDPALVAGAGRGLDVPDPYYGTARDFDECLTMIESSVDGLVTVLSERTALGTRP